MADFVDYTNVTELEKFSFKLNSMLKEINSDEGKNIQFRGVEFKLSKISAKEDSILCGIPHFRFPDSKLAKSFDLKEFWLLECTEKGRVLSEGTGRLLLGTLIQNISEAVFVRVGEVEVSEKFLGFCRNSLEYFETFPGGNGSDAGADGADSDLMKSAQIVLEWFPGNLRVVYPGFTGYFDSWHPIERIEVSCVWPQIPREGLKFKREELGSAPIMISSYEEAEDLLPLRNSMLRSIQSAHLREILFTKMGTNPLVSFPVSKEGNFAAVDSLDALYSAISGIYRSETERLEKDITMRYAFIPKRVQEIMRWERLNESFSLIWRRFVKGVEESWNNLKLMRIESDDEDSGFESGEIENSLRLVNWCIERELEWQESLKDHVLLRSLYRIPPRHLYTAKIDLSTVDEKIDVLREKLQMNLSELGRTLSNESEDQGDQVDQDDDKDDDQDLFKDCIDQQDNDKDNYKGKDQYVILEHGYDLDSHVVYEPFTLNCEPPPSKLLTKSLLKNPLAGDVIALNQLREDMRVFKAWNEELCKVECFINVQDGLLELDEVEDSFDFVRFDLGFVGFLLWHSPNDVERVEVGGKTKMRISQRMRDNQGQWHKMWKEPEEDSHPRSLNKQVSFNHRALLGQVISDLTLKIDLNQLLESATPFITRRAAELIDTNAVQILRREESAAKAEGANYPLDRINEQLDEYERRMTKQVTLQALCSDIFTEKTRVLIPDEASRQFLLNREHEFKIKCKEIVSESGGFKEIPSGYEAIRIKRTYP